MARNYLTPQEENNKKIIAKNINSLLLEQNKTQTDLCEATGIPKSTINGYVKGTSLPNAGNLQKIADYFNVGKSYIDPRFSSNKMLDNGNFVNIPIIGVISCGNPITAVENIDDYRIRSSDNLPVGNLFYLYAKGDSMSPTINDKDLVLIKEQSNADNGDIIAVLFCDNDEVTLKRIKTKEDITLLIPDNSKYEPIIINKNSNVKIIGKAVEVISNL